MKKAELLLASAARLPRRPWFWLQHQATKCFSKSEIRAMFILIGRSGRVAASEDGMDEERLPRGDPDYLAAGRNGAQEAVKSGAVVGGIAPLSANGDGADFFPFTSPLTL